jgi:hypothetical protein
MNCCLSTVATAAEDWCSQFMLLANLRLFARVYRQTRRQIMKLPRVSWLASTALFFFALSLLLPGCSKKGGVVLDSATFSSAPPEVREKWKAAAEFASRRNYLAVATNLMEIFSKSQQLTPEQNDALNQAWLKLGNQAFEAANRGDKAATEVVLKMKESGIGDRRTRR